MSLILNQTVQYTSHDQAFLKRTETATHASMVVATRGERGSLLMVRRV